jgi:hypothetical protein
MGGKTKVMDFKNNLINGKSKLGVWGCGYIGFTTMINFAQQGVFSRGYDVDSKVVEILNYGRPHITNIDYWLGFNVDNLIKKTITATINSEDMMSDDVNVHLIAVPTEKDGEPYFKPLKDVMNKISKKKPNPDLIIIESTLTPGMFDDVVVGTLEKAGWKVGKDFLVGIAPRRDWFDSPEKNVKNLKRVIGGTTPETTEEIRKVLSIICDNLIPSDAHTVELVKSVENSILHVCATYAEQLAFAYPDRDIAEVLRLAATHWRIPLYFPSVGTGGYCIPVAPKYILEGAKHAGFLTIIKDALGFDSNMPNLVSDIMVGKVINKSADKSVLGKSIGVLGLSYKRDIKVHTLSPALKIIKRLEQNCIEVKVFDPYYSKEEIKKLTGVDTFKYPDDLGDFDGLIIVPPHRLFGQTTKQDLFNYLVPHQVILDNEGIWNKWREDFTRNDIEYHTVGDKDWSKIY